MKELSATLDEIEADPKVAAIVITGSEKAFAAGELCMFAARVSGILVWC